MNTVTLETVRFPEGFKALLEENALPMPALPLEAIDQLNQVTASFYATSGIPEPKRFSSVKAAQAFLAQRARYAGYGVVGHGVQSREVVYVVKTGHLQFALSLPWSRLYGDPEEEQAALRTALDLAETCLAYATDEARGEEDSLSVILTSQACYWSWNIDGLTHDGETLEGLVQRLEQTLAPNKTAWVQV